jgi:hypothetical protein
VVLRCHGARRQGLRRGSHSLDLRPHPRALTSMRADNGAELFAQKLPFNAMPA